MFRYYFGPTVFFFSNPLQEELSHWGYRHQELPDGTVGVVVSHLRQEKVISVVQVMAMFLVKLREFAELNLKTKVRSFFLEHVWSHTRCRFQAELLVFQSGSMMLNAMLCWMLAKLLDSAV